MSYKKSPLVGIIMGSKSDARIMIKVAEVLDKFGIKHEDQIVSAHRTPTRLEEYAKHAKKSKFRVIIAGAAQRMAYFYRMPFWNAKNRANEALKPLGNSVSDVKTVNLSPIRYGGYDMQYSAKAESFSSAPIFSSSEDVTASVHVVFTIQ